MSECLHLPKPGGFFVHIDLKIFVESISYFPLNNYFIWMICIVLASQLMPYLFALNEHLLCVLQMFMFLKSTCMMFIKLVFFTILKITSMALAFRLVFICFQGQTEHSGTRALSRAPSH